ncbi:hypothetical protein FAM19404_02427 [Lacticaseibacillus paracasei]|uniref:hypothetical protein n=1 Tax=Lacticaseibacillus paracasei TaxID=1597 RepID=UPI000FF6D1B7|nr:hypothetical protein [Lacticaseibacillus paracasei]RND95700.1 hypothetical protein FAM19404_02427 [Lacticaseibacillus paracasei]
MDIDIHITNATPEDIKKAFQAIAGSKEHKDEAIYLDAPSSIASSSKNRRC